MGRQFLDRGNNKTRKNGVGWLPGEDSGPPEFGGGFDDAALGEETPGERAVWV